MDLLDIGVAVLASAESVFSDIMQDEEVDDLTGREMMKTCRQGQCWV